MGYKRSDCGKYLISDIHQAGPISQITNGFYFELLVFNNTKFPIGVIDKHNSRYTVKNTTGVGKNDVITITYRQAVNISRKQHYHDIPIPSVTMEIPYSVLINEPVYVKEVDLLLCNEGSLNSFNHPHKAAGLDEILDEYFKKLDKSLTVPTLKVYGNDTTGKIKKAHMMIFNTFCQVQFTNWEHCEDCVTIIFPDQKGNPNHYKIPLEELVKSEGKVKVKTKYDPFDIYLALEASTIRNCLDKEEQEKVNNSLEEIIKEEKFKMTEENKKYKKRVEDAIKEDYRLKMEESAKEIKELKEEAERLKKLINSADGYLNFTSDKMEYRKKEMSYEEAKYKHMQTMAKITIPIVIGVVGYVVGKSRGVGIIGKGLSLLF